MHGTDRFDTTIAQITRAFGNFEYIGDDHIVRLCDEDNLSDWDVVNIKRAFMGKRWQDVTLELLDKQTTGFTGYFTFDAFRYYLPAFLVSALEPSGKGIWTIGVTLSQHLSPNWYSDTDINDDIDRLELNKEQRVAVRQFFEVLTAEFPELFGDEQLESQQQIHILMKFWREYSTECD